MGKVELSTQFGDRLITLESGKLAKQADGAVLARCGDTIVLATVVAGKELIVGQDFFPLTVDFQEKFYAAGRIPGGFLKRESKPQDLAILAARLIDRPLRPLFPDDFLNETVITVTVLSHDGENDPQLLGIIASSSALLISDIPFNGPVGACRIGYHNGKFVANFNSELQTNMDILVAAVRDGVIMVEGSAKEVSEELMIDALDFAYTTIQPVLDLQDELCRMIGKPKRSYTTLQEDESLKENVKQSVLAEFPKIYSLVDKKERYNALENLTKQCIEKYGIKEPLTETEINKNLVIKKYFSFFQSNYLRQQILNTKKRIDGRGYEEIRPISTEVSVLPRTHGSALFTRGETQVLSTVTLGTKEDEQKIDSILGSYQKTFFLHYNFPPFSVGEAKPTKAPGRREIGHGTLAERALSYVIPSREEFPYTIRLVAEVLESNGSSSMATVCSGSMALMDAGVPLKKPVAGVAIGLIKENESVAILTDIIGDEDHLGDMDFKVCGTFDGITAFQMDLKIGGINREIMQKALQQAKEGRLFILDKMSATISQKRESLSSYAPRIFTLKVKPEKIREIIGSGGKVIRGILEETGVKIDIDDDGTVNIASNDENSANKAIDLINKIVEEPEKGKIYEGKVVRIADFGAFVEIMPGVDGLLHISELDHRHVRRVEDVVHVGDSIRVKCIDIDSEGKIRLSRKVLLPNNDFEERGQENIQYPYDRNERSQNRDSRHHRRNFDEQRRRNYRDRGYKPR